MEEYKTKDLHVAAALTSLNHNITRLDPHPTDSRTKFFVFINEPNAKGRTPKQDADGFFKKELRVEPYTYTFNITNLREWARR